MSNEDKIAKWASLVPELYYDLIGRVPPGALLVVAVMWTLGLFSTGSAFDLLKAQNWALPVVYLILLFAAGYATGILLTPLGYLFRLSYMWWAYRVIMDEYHDVVGDLCEKVGLEKPTFRSSDVHIDRINNEMYEFVAKEGLDTTNVLPKMSAEAELCNNTAAALILLLLLNLYIVAHLQNPGEALLAGADGLVLLVASIALSGCAGCFRVLRRTARLCAMVSRGLGHSPFAKHEPELGDLAHEGS